jgi:hypothetical protein
MLMGGLRYLLPVIEKAHQMGVYVITADYIPDNIAHKYSDEYCNVSIVDKEAVLEKAKELDIDGIMSFAVDPGVVTAAYVAEKLGLPFQCSYEAASILQDKSKFRGFLRSNNFNTPNACGYDNINKALSDKALFKWPVIVKPVDSAGSKGVTKVSCPDMLESAIDTALEFSLSKKFIIEEYINLTGYQSSADIFCINGTIVHCSFSDQMFDVEASNPFTPAIEIWPSSMASAYRNELEKELQRLLNLLNVKNGIFNVESRVGTDGKTYIMEVSPRGGGNRIAEIQSLASGQDLIFAEICNSLRMDIENICQPEYSGVWCNYILHSNRDGLLEGIYIDPVFEKTHVVDKAIIPHKGDNVHPFTGANTSLGTIFLKFGNRKELDSTLEHINSCISVKLQ